jgi:hypothetical protein
VVVGGYNDAGTDFAQAHEVRFLKGFTVRESADHPYTPVPGSGRGQHWVRASDGKPVFTSADGIDYDLTEGTGGTGLVDSVFGRQNDVVAMPSDYAASQIDNDSTASGAFVDDALTSLQSLVGTAQSTANAAQSDATSAKTKTDRITVTQAVNLDTMESDGVTNNAKISYTDAATVAAHQSKLSNVTTISTFGAALLDDASVAAQRATLELGSAAQATVGTSIGNLPQLVNVGGNAGLPAVDGSNLTGISAAADITVVDEVTTLTTTLTKLTFAGTGVVATEPGAEGEILVTVTSGAPGVLDVTDGTTTV